MKTILKYTDKYRSEYNNEYEIEGENERDLFIQIEKINNRDRYANGCHTQFKDSVMQTKYLTWLHSDDYKAISFQLYYGGGVVD